MSKWSIKGQFYESCRAEGPCPLWFRQDMWDKPCQSWETIEIEEGHVNGVDMKGIIIIHHVDDIGPSFEQIMREGFGEGAVYISDNATPEQRKVLGPWVENHLGAIYKRYLGTKFVKIEIKKEGSTYDITMPFGEQKIEIPVGGDEKTPIGMTNCIDTRLTNYKFGVTRIFKYWDYGKDIEWHNSNGDISDFLDEGED